MAQTWSFVAAGAVSTGSSLTLAVPAGVVAGDQLLIVLGYSNGSTVPATPSGWSVVFNTSSDKMVVFAKTAGGSESSVSISTALGTGVMLAYRGISAEDVLGTYATASGTTIDTTSLTTTAADDLVISAYRSDSSNNYTWTAPGSTNVRVNVGSAAGANGGLLIVDEDKAVAGATTARTATNSLSASLISLAVSFKQNLPVGGTLAATEADDTITAAGAVKVQGASGITTDDDTAAAAGTVKVQGSASITDADDAASGGSAPPLSLNFLTSETLDSRITATGGTNGTRINSSGVPVAATTPRYDYDPVTLLPKGLLIEQASTNLLLNSLLNGTSLSTQSVTVTAQAYTLSFYGAGSITLSGAASATLTGGGAFPNRASLTFTPSAGTLTLTVTGTVQYANLEAGNFATSFIPTAGASVTRSADVLSMTSTNFSSWFNQSEGTFVVEGEQEAITSQSGKAFSMSVDGGNTSLYQFYLNNGASSIQTTYYDSSSVIQVDMGGNSPSLVQGRIKRAATYYKVNDSGQVSDGGTIQTDTVCTPGSPTRLHIGTDRGNSGWLNGHVRRLDYYSSRMADTQLRTLTAPTAAGAITEADDTTSGAGGVKVQGAGAVTEADDAASGAGAVKVQGAGAVTEADDTASGAGAVKVQGAAAITTADDTVAGAGAVKVQGAGAVTEAGDSVAATARAGAAIVTPAGRTAGPIASLLANRTA